MSTKLRGPSTLVLWCWGGSGEDGVGAHCVHLDSRTEVDGLTALPCAEPHSAQVITTGSLPEGEYPGTTAIAAMVDSRCAAAFDRALQGDPAYDVLTLAPTDLTWHDRGYSCLVVHTDGSDIVGDVALVTG